ncbi:MAG: twin-arginine translocation signal domain-containing protein [Tannerella sp.]|jgi:hypothetical protein|nr:twin-arginine translocation signal domain-containing protein [Tannerella sp.]
MNNRRNFIKQALIAVGAGLVLIVAGLIFCNSDTPVTKKTKKILNNRKE